MDIRTSLPSAAPPFSSFVAPQDAIPYEAALSRLIRAGVVGDEQLMDYELNQALRGLTVAVKHSTQRFFLPFSATTLTVMNTTETAGEPTAASRQHADVDAKVFGREAVLYRMCVTAVTTPATLPTLVYLSTRLLCDEATSYGEGNARPCCTEEWIHVLDAGAGGGGTLSTADRSVFSSSSGLGSSGTATSAVFRAQVAVDRRFQLGYLRLVAGTLRLIACGAVTGRHLFADYLALVQVVLTRVLAFAAIMAEGKADSIVSSRALPAQAADDSREWSAPSMLTAEANSFIIQCTYWLSMDALDVHLEKNSKTKAKAVRVLDRAAPQLLWDHVPRLRSAFVRAFSWLEREMVYHTQRLLAERQRQREEPAAASIEGRPGQTLVKSSSPRPRSCHDDLGSIASAHVAGSFPRSTRGHVCGVLTSVLKEQEQLDYARRAALQRFGESSSDVHKINEAMWGATLRLCILLQSVTGAWVGVQGGLGLGATTHGLVMQSNRDLLVFLASCLSRLPAAEESNRSSQTSPANTLAATDALLSAAVAVAAAAPIPAMQSDLWASEDGAITREVHRALTQRGLRFTDTRVLQLTSLLLNSIMNVTTASGSGGGVPSLVSSSSSSLLATETANQLLTMLSESRDAASHVAVELLMGEVGRRPHVLIPQLFRLLNSDNPSARTNALDVLAGLPRALSGAFSAPTGEADSSVSTAGLSEGGDGPPVISVDADRRREVLRLLAEQLLLHLQDEELVTRMESAALFAKVCPEDVMYPLLNQCLQRDPRGVKQSASKAALNTVVTTHGDSADVVLLLLQEAFHLLVASSSSGALRKTTATTRNHQEATEEREETKTNAITNTVARAVPTTPAEAFTKALLYATADDHEDANNESDKNLTGQPATEAGQGKGTTAAVKAERLHGLVSSLCRVWVGAVTSADSVRAGHGVATAQHVEPILSATRSLVDPEAQQFYIRHVTSILSMLTARTQEQVAQEETLTTATVDAGGAGTPGTTTVTQSQAAVVEAIHRIFSLGHTEPAGDSLPKSPTWLTQIAVAAAAEEKPGTSTSEAVLYQILLPLLCLRSCDSYCFVQLGSTDEGGKSYAAEVFDSVFAALLQEPYRAFFCHHQSDVQRVLLEVACKAPPHLFFSRIRFEDQQWGVGGSLTFSSSFTARVAVFAVCSYLATRSWSGGVATAPLFLDRCAHLLCELRSVLWLRSDDVPTAPTSGHSAGSMDVLRRGWLDAVALVTLRALVQSADGPAVQQLQGFLRAGFERVSGGSSSDDPPRQAQQTSLVPEVHQHMLTIIAAHPDASKLLALWFVHFEPTLIALANAACKHEAKPCPTAVACGELLFRAIMLSSKVNPSVASSTTAHGAGGPSSLKVDVRAAGQLASPSATSGSEDASFFTRHRSAGVNCDALVSFGIGCARSNYGVPLQQVGVRILAALLGAALDCLLTLEPCPLDTIFAVLQKTALIHEDATTRHLAEQVLQSMSGLTTPP